MSEGSAILELTLGYWLQGKCVFLVQWNCAKGRLTPRTHQVKEHPVEMGQISALYYADYYLSGGHIGVVNTGEEWN